MPARGLDRRLLDHARRANLFPQPGGALLAVSGGPDSVALLDLLHAVAPDLGLTLIVAHVDHGILPDSGRLAQQVGDVAGRYGVPMHLERLGLGPGTSETRARAARYAALRTLQERTGTRYLVTAHHADDQIETVLYRVLRGSGLAGLAGMRPVGPGGLVRPLLPFRRQELAEWLAARFPEPAGRPPVHLDPSNQDVRHDRSWIRGHVLPVLRRRFGDRLEQRLQGLAAHAAREREAWAALLAALPELEYRLVPHGVEIARAPLAGYQPALAEAVLRALAREAGSVVGPRRSARLLAFALVASSGRLLELGQGFAAEIVFDRLRVARAMRAPVPATAEWGRGNEGSVWWGRWELSWRPEPAGTPQRGGWITWVEPGGGVVRAVAAGDKLVPLGGRGRRPARRLLMEARVAKSARAGYPLLLRGVEPVWLPGVCRAASGVPRPGEPSLRLQAQRPADGVGAGEEVG